MEGSAINILGNHTLNENSWVRIPSPASGREVRIVQSFLKNEKNNLDLIGLTQFRFMAKNGCFFLSVCMILVLISAGCTNQTVANSKNFSDPSLNLQVVDSKIVENRYGARAIEGTIKNNAAKTFSNVTITIELYDSSGQNVGTTFTHTNNLESGATWEFSAPFFKQSITSYQIKAIRGF